MERTDRMRVALICDFAEENWPSMDLAAEMLMENLAAKWASRVEVERIRPSMKRRFVRLPRFGKTQWAYSADRLLNRFCDYPRYLTRIRGKFDLYHIVDHSYSHLVHALPAEPTIVSCYDLDTFRCLLNSESEPRSSIFKLMTSRILDGFRLAAKVSCASAATRDEIAAHGLVPLGRTTVIPLGAHPACVAWPDPAADMEVSRMLGPFDLAAIDIVHVGAPIARKRIDVMLRVLARLRVSFPGIRLIRVGGPLSTPLKALAERLELNRSIVTMPFVSRRVLAAVYRRAAMLVLPSEREGFGLPIVEAMACGTPVVVSDLPVLREVAGPSATFCRVAEIASWTDAMVALLEERHEKPERWRERKLAAISWARRFSWREHARKTVQIYEEVLSGLPSSRETLPEDDRSRCLAK